MQISFLAAGDNTPLTKRFALENDEITKTAYPMVRDFTSFTYRPGTLAELYQLTEEHASKGHCMLKGTLTRELQNEPRAGTTNTTAATDWILLDLDGVSGFETVEDFISSALGPEFADRSYIIHWSSSQGFGPGLRCHILFRLSQPKPAPSLKQWLEDLNYSVPKLRAQLELSASGTTLKYPLDITTCQNDKLIFIAHPQFQGLEDPVERRIEFVEKKHEFVQLSLPHLNPEILRSAKDEIVASLRQAAGLPAKKINYKVQGSTHYVTNPDQAAITGERKARGFVYLNLNGGDSWAYYYPTDNPEFLHSFKEPGVSYKLKDINPEYYANAKRVSDEQTANPATTSVAKGEKIPFAFRDFKTDTYYNGIYDTSTGRHRIAKTSGKDKIKDFYGNYGLIAPKVVPDWERVFDPTSNEVINFERAWINTFTPTDFLVNAAKATEEVKEPPLLIQRIIKHALAYDDDSYSNFINWLACIIQFRCKIGTAWVLTGTEGTGKGLITEHIIAPILGRDYCPQKGLANIEDSFNAWVETCLVLTFNEARMKDTPHISKLINRIKQWITEPFLTIRAMRQEQMQILSFMNIIFTSNYNDAIKLTLEDRRFWIAPRQDQKIEITMEEIAAIPGLLQDFATYLQQYPADLERARTIEVTQSKIDMIEAGMNSSAQFFHAMEKGNVEFMTRYLTKTPDPMTAHEYHEYERVIKEWLTDAKNGETSKASREQLYTAYNYLQGARNLSQNKFVRLCTYNNVPLKRMRSKTGDLIYGREINWSCDKEVIDYWLPSVESDSTESADS